MMNKDFDAKSQDTERAWQDKSLPAADRVEKLLSVMTLPEKVAQLYGVWVGAASTGGDVAPHQHDLGEDLDFGDLITNGLGQLTRSFGSAPVDAGAAALSLVSTQRRIVEQSRLGIPAMAHEECLAGFSAWGATAYPVPLSWGATFNPAIVEKMASRIGQDMRSVGVHQGLAPVLDVVRDARWGRVEETIGEDPYLVGTVGSAYVRGLESSGVVSTLKHFVGYSASRAGRNLAPVSVGPRELADVLLPPFEMALREGGARSVMNSYSDIDGIPSAADRRLLTELLRDKWGFEGTVVADYFAIAFLKLLHGTASTWAEAAGAALEAGIDVELPTVKTFGEPLQSAVQEGVVSEGLIDRALRRVLNQKLELGLLDSDWNPIPAALQSLMELSLESARASVNLDSFENRALAREIAEQSVVLVRNEKSTLPLTEPKKIALIGPNADETYAMLGCYSFPTHVVSQHEGVPLGIEIATFRQGLEAEFPGAEITFEKGTGIDDLDMSGIPAAVASARNAEVALVVLGDRAGLFGRGTSGEGCDAPDLSLPGAQQALLDSVISTGTPTVVILLTGRPYALGSAANDSAAIVQAFFPGEEGAHAIVGVLSGRVWPSGRLPVSLPNHPGAQPSTYLAAPLARASDVSSIDPTPVYPFGHGLSFADVLWTDLQSVVADVKTDQAAQMSFLLTNQSDRDAVEIVQVYLSDPVASVVRPVQRLVGFLRVQLAAKERRRVHVSVPMDLTSFTGIDFKRIVEPGEITLGFGRSSADIPLSASFQVVGEVRELGHDRLFHPEFSVSAPL